MKLVNLFTGVFFGVGLFLILEDIFKLPYRKTRKSVSAFAKIRNRNSPGNITKLLDEISVRISKYIKLDDYRIDQMNVELRNAGITETPELYISKCIVKSILVLFVAIPLIFVFPLGIPVVVASAIVVFLSSVNKLKENAEKKRKHIEYELPRFVSYISKTLTHNRDVLSLMENYLDNAGEVFGKELLVTVADMKSGNYESAITRMETRVSSSMLSDVSRGLVSMLRGDDTVTYWKTLEIKFSDYQRQLLKQSALKVPSKVRRLSFCLLVCFILIYVVVLGVAIIDGVGVLF